jgi:hypothetical protein
MPKEEFACMAGVALESARRSLFQVERLRYQRSVLHEEKVAVGVPSL